MTMFHRPTIRWAVLIFVFLMLGPVFYGAKQSWDGQANRVEDWLPASFPETKRLAWFVEQFGSDELVMVSWPGCTLDDVRLDDFATRLTAAVSTDGSAGAWYQRAWTGKDLLQSLSDPPAELTRRDARQRLEGWIIGERELTCVIAQVSERGAGDRHAAIEFLFEVADEVSGLSRDQIHVAGPTYDGVAVDRASQSSLLLCNIGSFAVCLLLLYACFRSAMLTWLVFASAFFSEQLSMAFMHYSGTQMDSVLLLVANLTFVLGIAGGVHLANYYCDALQTMQGVDAVQAAVEAARRPCLWAAATTALAMISLTVSRITPIRNFGWYAAISVMVGAVVLLVVLPVSLAQFCPKLPAKRRSTSRDWP